MDLSPNDVEPFNNTISMIASHLYITTNSSFPVQVYLLSGLFAFLLVIQLLSIAIRIKNRSWWIFKLVRGPVENKARFIVPNAIILYSISSAVFLIPLFNSAWAFVWATSITPILSPLILKHDDNFLSRHPLCVNIFFVLIPFVVLAILLGLTIDLNARFNQAYSIYLTIARLIQQQSIDASLIKSLEVQIDVELIRSSKAWDRVFKAYYIICAFFLVIFISAAIIHIRVLGTALRSHKSTNPRSSRRSRSHEFNSLVWAYRTLVFTCAAIISIAVVYLVVAVLITLEPMQATNPSSVWLGEEFIILGASYCYLIFGGSAIIAIFLRSFVKPGSSCDFNTRSLTLPIEEIEEVQVVVVKNRIEPKSSQLDFDLEEKADIGSRTNLCE